MSAMVGGKAEKKCRLVSYESTASEPEEARQLEELVSHIFNVGKYLPVPVSESASVRPT